MAFESRVAYGAPAGTMAPFIERSEQAGGGVIINAQARQWVVERCEQSSTTTASHTTTSANTSSTRQLRLHTLTDDGAGNFIGDYGTVAYSAKTASVRFVRFGAGTSSYSSDYEKASEFKNTAELSGGSTSGNNRKGGNYGTAEYKDEVLAGSSVVAKYEVAGTAPSSGAMEYTPPAITIDLAPYTTDRIVPGSVRFVWMGETYDDFEGRIYRGRTSVSNGFESGRIDYQSGVVTMTDYAVGPNPAAITLQSLWTQKAEWRTASVFFMTDASPIQPGQITITVTDVKGNLINVACDLNGNLTGTHARGHFEFQNGLGELQFGDFVTDASLTPEDKAEWWYSPADVGTVEAGKIWRPWPVDPTSLRYNAVSNFYLPVDPAILGLDPVRLPQDGRVPIYRKGRVVVIGNNQQLAPATYSAGTVDLGRTRISHVWLIDANGHLITSGWGATEAQMDSGHITITNATSWAQPVTIEHRVQDMALCTDVQIDGTISLNIPLSHNYPAGSVVSSAVLFGTTFARVANVFDQQTWDGVTWSDSVQGNPAVASYNDAANPILVTNAGALSERYALRFKSDATTFDLIGEFSGGIGTGSKNAPFSPSNPFKPGTPLFQMAEAGWGSGWVAGNTVFVQLVGAMQSMALIRTVQPGTPTGLDYSFDLLTGGDIDRPPSAP